MKQLAGYIVTGIISLVVGLLLQRFSNRPRLLYWVPGSFLFDLRQFPQPAQLRTDSLTIQNVGRQPATNVEIIHRSKPDHFQFSTPVAYIEDVTPAGEHVIRIPAIGPKEHINIQLLSYTASPVLLSVRSAEGKALLIQVHLQRRFPRSYMLLLQALLLIGAGFVVYWLASAVLFISKAIGLLP